MRRILNIKIQFIVARSELHHKSLSVSCVYLFIWNLLWLVDQITNLTYFTPFVIFIFIFSIIFIIYLFVLF